MFPKNWPSAIGYTPWIEEVWVNYISNAIKYGGEPPYIELGAEEKIGKTLFWIKDNGAGIDPEQQSQIFIKSTRLNEKIVKGHGLGLTIVKRIVEKLGGQVGITSTVGKGSTFTFELPSNKNRML